MSELTDKIAAEHTLQDDLGQVEEVEGTCGCGVMFVSHFLHAEHLAEATEQAVRAQIAADIRGARYCEEATPGEPYSYDEITIDAALNHAARIAEGQYAV